MLVLQVRDARTPILKKAADALRTDSKHGTLRREMDEFRSANPWVEDSALFFCLIKFQVSSHKRMPPVRLAMLFYQSHSQVPGRLQSSQQRLLPSCQQECMLLSACDCLHLTCISTAPAPAVLAGHSKTWRFFRWNVFSLITSAIKSVGWQGALTLMTFTEQLQPWGGGGGGGGGNFSPAHPCAACDLHLACFLHLLS